MGLLIFAVLLVIEVLIMFYRFYSKGKSIKIINFLRLSNLFIFTKLILLGIIEWSFRYYLLSALLLIQAGISFVDLFSERKEKSNKSLQIILRTVGLIMLYFIFSIPAILFPQTKEIEVTGPLQVQTATFTYEDLSRIETYSNSGENRKLTVQFWFPDNSEKKYPLVVFSHGSLGVRSSNLTLYRELASHGYVVASIDHTYQSFFTTHDNGKTIFLNMDYSRELQAEDARKNRKQSYELYQKWMTIRMGDINFVMDTIISDTKIIRTDLVYQIIDTDKIGVMGHSLGGSAALGIGRTRDDVRAVISLEAPFMYDIIDVEDGEFIFTNEKYPVPVLNVYSDSLWDIMGDRPQYAMNYSLLTDNEETTHNLHISGIGHLSLTDFALTSPILTRMIDGQKPTMDQVETVNLINVMSLAFFDHYLKEEGQFTSD